MNFHSGEWIMKRVREHYNEACEHFPEDKIVGVFIKAAGIMAWITKIPM